MTEPTLRPTLLCRAHLHHKWVPAHSEDGDQYLRCAHCGKDKTEVDTGDWNERGFGAGAVSGGSG